jgi:hypothetical protein
MPSAAPIRAKEYTISPISARWRNPAWVETSMLSSSARLRRIEHRRLPAGDDVPGPAHRAGRVDRHDLAGDEPVEQVTDRGEPLLDAWRGQLAGRGFDPGGDMHRLHGGDRRHADLGAPGQEFLRGAGIGPARVRVADVGREEFEEADARAVTGGGHQLGQEMCRVQDPGDRRLPDWSLELVCHGNRLFRVRKSRTVTILVPS